MRFRITVRADGIELRGYIDGRARLHEFANALMGIAVVVASPATNDYNPFVYAPDGWSQFGTHANCRPQAQIEFSTEVGEDGMPLWERPVIEPIVAAWRRNVDEEDE